MGNSEDIKLGSVQETLLLPLWGRAVETQKPEPLLVDEKAVSIINSIPYDFSVIAENVPGISRLSWIARSIYFDNKIKAFTDRFPEAVIVNVGCGLDTTFDRVDNGILRWFDLDLPDVIELRRKYIAESDRRHFISGSVLDTGWYDAIGEKKKVMLLIAGVLYYFEEGVVKDLFNEFHTRLPGTEIIFDYASPRGISVSNKVVLKKGGMDRSATLKWGIKNIMELEQWAGYIRVISHEPMYKAFKKNYPFLHRVGMSLTDALKIMSLAHVRLNG